MVVSWQKAGFLSAAQHGGGECGLLWRHIMKNIHTFSLPK